MIVIDQPSRRSVADYEFEIDAEIRNPKQLSRQSSRLATKEMLFVTFSRQVVEDCNAFRELARSHGDEGGLLKLLSDNRRTSGMDVQSFVFHAQRLANRGRIDAALDIIYDRADEMMLAGEFKPLNDVIEDLNADELSLDILLGVLTVTSPAKSKLPARAPFYHAVESTLRARGEYVDGILTGLE